MPLTPGTKLGPYEIVSPLGAGGMGEVYKARDTRLGRDVAVKALPDVFQHDAERVARFQREAQVLASLNHPRIGQIYGLEEADNRRFLILEFVDGEALSARISRGALPVADAVTIARQMLDALEAAHDKGIVHRDLKPANVMLTSEGDVKVLDFGLARVGEIDQASDTSNSPTLTFAAATQLGVILGTAAYMSPEQAKGRTADRRSDVWAFGCVLYEMLTGQRAFAGDDLSDTLAAVLRSDPDWTLLPSALPAGVRTLLQRCLTRDRKARIPEIATVRFMLDDALATPSPAPVTPGAPAAPRRGSRWLGFAAAGGLVGLAAAGATWWLKPVPAEPHVVTRFQFTLPDSQNFSGVTRRTIAISPDGARLAYVANQQLYLRAMDQLEAHPVRGTNENPFEPLFSPDGQWLAYFTVAAGANGLALKKVAISGGASLTLAAISSPPVGASWGNGQIAFAINDASTKTYGVQVVPENGGAPRTIATVDPAKERAAHPRLLDDGRHVLFAILPTNNSSDEGQIVAQTIGGTDRTVILTGGTDPRVLPTGHLVYVHNGTLLAVRFDATRLAASGGPVPVVENVAETFASWTGHYALASNGTLVYLTGLASATSARVLVWVDRQGREQPVPAKPRAYMYPRLSPDGTRISVSSVDEENDIWVFDLVKQTLTRLTFGPASEMYSPWLPDGRSLIYSSGEVYATAARDLFKKASDGTGTAEPLTTGRSAGLPLSITPDGKQLLYRTGTSAEPNDLLLLPLDVAGGGGKAQPLLANPRYNERNGEISPDGRWLAYDSNESGSFEVYVRPFPNVDGGRWQVSVEGGVYPLWSRSGKELFFVTSSSPNKLMTVPISATASFVYGQPQTLFDLSPYYASTGRMYDVSPDGKRFLTVKSLGDESTQRPPIVVVSHWFDEVKARVTGAR